MKRFARKVLTGWYLDIWVLINNTCWMFLSLALIAFVAGPGH